MLPQEIIRKKRDKKILNKEEIDFFIKGITDETIADSQTAALTMAVFLNGLNREEIVNMTLAMRDSGDVLNWTGFDGPIIDKHSSGGVGDKISLMLAPMLAACGGYVPMISGRGLGHTGGTLDKFDSIPGYNALPDNKLFKKVVKETGCAIIGQTGNLAPADKKIYAIRDVCGTVESIPLITASILSKKLAAGLDCLVMDLKCGNGAFMSSFEDAKALAESIVRVANNAGTKTNAVLTDMNQVLGYNVGNALEVLEAVEYLKGENVDPRLHEVNMELCAELLVSSTLAKDLKEARQKLQTSIDSGKALEIFAKMVTELGGPSDFTIRPKHYLPKAKIVKAVFAKEEGYVYSMDTRGIGLSVIGLKGGRIHPDQKLDYATGFTGFCQIGDKADKTRPLAFVHAQTEEQIKAVENDLRSLIKISDKRPKLNSPIIKKVK
ncbi:MAG: thymidine phosphorylase [Lactobacillaceae bacterium]|jgi:thymidine phosphorylase|nr:thymidine phosphorylase [Lactobacillaceae bacterium]